MTDRESKLALIESVVELLTDRADSDERIARRVIYMRQFLKARRGDGAKTKLLAKQLGVTPAAISLGSSAIGYSLLSLVSLRAPSDTTKTG